MDNIAYINPSDIGNRYSKKYFGCSVIGGMIGLGPKMTESLPSIIAHELLGHGWEKFSGGDTFDQSAADRAENLYHAASGDGQERCETFWE